MKQMSGRTREKLEGAREVLLALLRDKEVYDELVGLGVREITNPAVTFTKDVKNGVWNEISDDVYNKALEKVEEASDDFGDQPYVKLDHAKAMVELFHTVPDMLRVMELMLRFDDLRDEAETLRRTLLEMRMEATRELLDDADASEESADEELELLEEVPADEMPEQDVDGEEQEDASEIEVKPAEDPLVQMLV